jgi:hypothetical protein
MTVSNKKSGEWLTERDTSMDRVVVRNLRISVRRSEDGIVTIRYPIMLRPWIEKFLNRFGSSSKENRFKKLQLDRLGSEVWDMVDDARSVRQITKTFADTHQLPIRESEIAVTQFLRDLGRRGIIGLK